MLARGVVRRLAAQNEFCAGMRLGERGDESALYMYIPVFTRSQPLDEVPPGASSSEDRLGGICWLYINRSL